MAAHPPSPSHPGRLWTLIGVVAVVQFLLVLLFAWPAARSTPSDLPIALAGPAQQVSGVAASIEAAQPGAFDLITVSDAAAARAAVTSREAYGALVLEQTGVTLYTAPAASTPVASALTAAIPAAVAEANPQAQVSVTALVPNPADDPTGQGLPISLIPLTITSIAAGAAIGLLARTRITRITAVLGYAVVAAVLSTLALQNLLGVLTGTWLANASVLALLCAAVAAATGGLASLLRAPGIALSATLIFFIGFPLSGAMSAWQLMPTPWGQLAQYLPMGAGNTALRGVAFFSGSGTGGAIAILATWAVIGLALAAVRPSRAAQGVEIGTPPAAPLPA